MKPALYAGMSAEEFGRHYRTMVELRAFARSIGVPTSGNKADLTDRISRALSGQAPVAKSPSPKRTLPEPLGADTELGGSVVLSRRLRQWFIDRDASGVGNATQPATGRRCCWATMLLGDDSVG